MGIGLGMGETQDDVLARAAASRFHCEGMTSFDLPVSPLQPRMCPRPVSEPPT